MATLRKSSALLLQGFKRALPKGGQLYLAHCALHAERKAIFRVSRIVDAILIAEQRSNETAELQDRMPVPTLQALCWSALLSLMANVIS